MKKVLLTLFLCLLAESAVSGRAGHALLAGQLPAEEEIIEAEEDLPGEEPSEEGQPGEEPPEEEPPADTTPPELLSFSVEGSDAGSVEYDAEKLPLYQNVEGPDVSITFSIIDEEEDWTRERLCLRVVALCGGRAVKELRGDSGELVWSDQGRQHTAVFAFDGEEDREEAYRLELSYRDPAGNGLIDGRTEEEFPVEVQEEQGLCLSGCFVLDRKAPRLGVRFSEAVRTVKDGKDCGISEITLDSASYYNEDILAEITLRDGLAQPLYGEDGAILGFAGLTFSHGGEDVSDRLSWSGGEDGVYLGTYRIDSEGDHRLTLSYCDAAGNLLRAEDGGENSVPLSLKEGSYTSHLLVLDRTAPVLSFAYTGEPVARHGERIYFDRSTGLRITVTDRNFRVGELREVLLRSRAEDSSGALLQAETSLETFVRTLSDTELCRTVWSAELPLTTEAAYTIPLTVTDLAGNEAILDTEGTDLPVAEAPGAEGSPALLVEYPVVDTSAPEALSLSWPGGTAVPYRPEGWVFSAHALTLRAEAADAVAGIREIRFILLDEQEETILRSGSFLPSASGELSVLLPPEARDFKGRIRTEIYDWAGNCTAENRSFAIESGERHEAAGRASLVTLTKPSRTVDGVDYYNGDVTLHLTLQDSFSGLRSVRYTGGNTLSGSRDYAAEAGSAAAAGGGSGSGSGGGTGIGIGSGPSGTEITYEYTQELTLEAAANNENGVRVSAQYTDNAGHTGSVEQSYHIDVTRPGITVEYDLNEPQNGSYYRQARTATVTIRERNFDERDVNFQITNTDGVLPQIGGWQSFGSGDDTRHVCRIVFEADGDYTFTLAFQDLAGNRAVYDRTDVFTIDRTAPELSVYWSGAESRDGYYYAGGRRAQLEVHEHNFAPELLEITVTAEGDAEEAPALSGWSREGDHGRAELQFPADGVYTLTVSGRDLAGNEFQTYESGEFVVDGTPPELSILGVADHSANRGEVRPVICWSDTNAGGAEAEIRLTGYRTGEADWEGEAELTERGGQISLEDFPRSRETDDMYTLEASVEDLAGNRSTASVSFSVNRFGSVYTLDAGTEALAGPQGIYYTREAPDILVTETNVDLLEYREVLCSRNGKLRTLQEGQEYEVEEKGGFPDWKQYVYRISAENFREEGHYLLTVHSGDRAKNLSDTGSEGKTLAFAVDRTAPTVLISGLEEGGRYRQGRRELTIDIEDNLLLTEAAVILNGEQTVYSAAQLRESGGRITMTVRGENHWQSLRITASDAAGNTVRTEELRFLLTPNLLVQLLMDRPLLYGAAGALLLPGGAFLLWLWRRKKR